MTGSAVSAVLAGFPKTARPVQRPPCLPHDLCNSAGFPPEKRHGATERLATVPQFC